MKVSVKAFGPEFQKGGKDFAVTGVPFQDLDSTLVEKKQIPPFCSFQLFNDWKSHRVTHRV